MELDKRVLEGKKPLTCYDLEEAKKYIGKECYFTSKLESFENLSKVPHATLHNIDDSSTPFWCYGDDGVLCYDCFILPCEWVKEVEYRPLTKDEFIRMFKNGVFGQWITMKSVVTENEYYMQVTGCFTSELDITYVCLGSLDFSFETLFKDFKWKDSDGNWRVFGVEVKDVD